MEKSDIEQPTKLKSINGSTETLDGFTDIGIQNTDEEKRERSSKNLSIILITIFIAWLLLFMGVTIYQIRSYRKVALKTEMERILNDELSHLNKDEFRFIKTAILRRLDGSYFTSDLAPEPMEPRNLKTAEVQELSNVETKVKSFLSPKSLNLVDRFEDLKFEKVSPNCYRKDYFRQNILNSGTNSRFIVKTANIGKGSSSNFGTCATSYYWIYNNPSTNETRIYYLGPYFGHHSVDVHEGLFDQDSQTGSFTLFGCQPPVGDYKTDPELRRMQTIIQEKAYITPNSYKSKDFAKFQIDLDRFAREGLSAINQKLDELHFDPEAVRDYTTLKEATSCIYSL